jgi:hypothetical protein
VAQDKVAIDTLAAYKATALQRMAIPVGVQKKPRGTAQGLHTQGSAKMPTQRCSKQSSIGDVKIVCKINSSLRLYKGLDPATRTTLLLLNASLEKSSHPLYAFETYRDD